ncbi:helix-turn-helix domain-containing protein [Pseudomonas sp. RIT-PI-S]|uniref:helix-turn-helix domain-containing protein n=1 Tax=Pseudomonas sp. RIT-PI-S TaxID=3035295 RepID=UPI0021DA27F6|nr:helix-turn-helix domain-containing protein [Pseudomonas sp. RIT-PI-S]
MSWALALPKSALADSSARHVLLCLANYAGSDGKGAFPSAATLSDDTGLSERTVRYKLDSLETAGLIMRGNQAIAAVYIDRHDRRPVVYDLALKRGANPAPRSERGANDDTGCSQHQSGVQTSAERGAATAPNTSLIHQVTEEQQLREECDRQDRAALEPQPAANRFAMFAAWAPDAEALTAQATIAAVPLASITDAAIRSFKGFFVAKPTTRDSAGGWCYRLVTWVKRERVKAAASGTVPDFDDTSWANDLGDL